MSSLDLDRAPSSLLRHAQDMAKDDPRFCYARLKIILDSLPVTIALNPLSVAVTAFALWLGRAEFGAIAPQRVKWAIAAQCLSAFAAWVVRYRHLGFTQQEVVVVRRRLIGLQVLIGLCWGFVGWMLWVKGNGANNGVVTVLLVMSLWAMALTRCSARTVFLTGVISLVSPMIVRFVVAGDLTTQVYLLLLPAVVGFVVFSGMAARKRVDDMLTARFAHEDQSRELAAARDEAIRKRQEAESANASKTAFLANMSHELRTPLNAIIGFSEIIATQALGAHNVRYPEYADDIHASGSHLLTLINEILDVAKIEAGRMEIDPRPLDVCHVMEAIERIMAVRCEEKALKTSYTVDPGLPSVIADERAFRQILLNLLSNAIKFTPRGGTIDVECRNSDDRGMVVSVADNGAGIPADKLALLFKPFTQVDNRFDHHHGGTGLGLALVQGLARLHGGRAWIDSTEGVGTTVYVYFPLEPVNHELTMAAE